ncbi:MAG: hypothetical protein L0219_14185 [Phycisphaerales bacterium]|nr:hypothetical protein [Phycisphaerales bacterium]MCI0676454.1 hypothetical protein [Phycisphaerales bacterium]
MLPDKRFLKQPKTFWANVRSISQHLQYTNRKTKQIKVHDLAAIQKAMTDLGLTTVHVVDATGKATAMGQLLVDYFAYRAHLLNTVVEPQLMDAAKAEALYNKIKANTRSTLPVVMNKQKGKKKKPAYLTNMVNWLIDDNAAGMAFDSSPGELTTFTQTGAPLRTLARRVDGAFPSCVNPVAIWEYKEYYYTTTFGSRVADGVYETLLDGMELEELAVSERIECKHYMFLDAHYTWWIKGRSYLCRVVDMLHMGYVDEVIVGTEIEDRVPKLAQQWVAMVKARQPKKN